MSLYFMFASAERPFGRPLEPCGEACLRILGRVLRGSI